MKSEKYRKETVMNMSNANYILCIKYFFYYTFFGFVDIASAGIQTSGLLNTRLRHFLILLIILSIIGSGCSLQILGLLRKVILFSYVKKNSMKISKNVQRKNKRNNRRFTHTKFQIILKISLFLIYSIYKNVSQGFLFEKSTAITFILH